MIRFRVTRSPQSIAAVAVAALVVLGGGCATTQRLPGAGSSTQALAAIELDFGWGAESPAEAAFASDFRNRLSASVGRGEALDGASIVAALDATVRGSLASDRLSELLGWGTIDWYESVFDWGEGNLLHVDFSIANEKGFVAELAEITQPSGRTLQAWVYGGRGDAPAFSTRALPVPSFSGVDLEVGELFDHFQNLTSAMLRFHDATGREMGVYRCFPADDPEWTAFSFQTPQDLASQAASLETVEAALSVSDHWVLSDPDHDLALLYQQISIVRAGKSPAERVDRLLEILRKAGEDDFLSAIASVRFPDGEVMTVESERFRDRVIRVDLGGDPARLLYLRPGSLATAYDSGWLPKRWLERAAQDESFNFGTWLPDLWRGDNEELFVSVYRINRARALAGGGSEPERALFDRTVHDLTGIGVEFDRVAVQIHSSSYEIQISEADIGRFLSELGGAGAQGPHVPGGAAEPMPSGSLSWKLERFEEGGLTFYRDRQFVYYEVGAQDLRPGEGLDGVRRRLRARLPGRYDYPLAFSGFRDEHLAPGLLLVVPESPEARAIASDRLRNLIDDACRAEGLDVRELTYALVWNESRAGRDNFFRFEEGRLDAVARLRARLSGADRSHFEEIYGRFGALLAGSYGPGHILYENAWAMGFRGSPGELAAPEVNLRYVVRFLRLNGIDRRTPLATVSRLYNGPGYARNGYHLRLAQNLERAVRAYASAAP